MNFIGNEPILRSTGLSACRVCKIVRIRKHHTPFSHVSCQWMKPFTRLKEDHPRNRNILEIKKNIKKNMGSIAQHIGSGNVWDTESQKIFVYLCPSCDPCLELPELGQGRETLIGVVAGDWLVLKIISELARGPHGLIYVMYCHVIQYQSTLIMHFAAHGGIITQY